MKKKYTYTVWVCGMPDIKAVSYEIALKVYRDWVSKGFDDVIMRLDS